MIRREGPIHSLIQRGIEFYDDGNTEKALNAFRKAGAAKPNLPVVSYWLGRIHSEENQHAMAVPEFRKLSNARKNNYRYAFFLEQALRMAGEPLSRTAKAIREPSMYAEFTSASPAAMLSRMEFKLMAFCAVP